MNANPHSTMRWVNGPALVFVVLFLSLQVMAPARMLRDPGTFWHTIVGERILQTGEFPRHDEFTFSRAGEPWIAQQWLGEVAMALVHRAMGIDGLVLLSNAAIAAMFAFLAVRLRKTGLPWPAVCFLLMLVFAASCYHFMPRPHLATILFMAVAMVLLCDVEAGRADAKQLLWLVPLFMVWVNTHGGALGGLATLLIVAMLWLLGPSERWRVSGDRRLVARPLIITSVVGLCLLTVLINPYGTALPRVWLGLLGSKLLPRMMIEHAPPAMFSPEWLMISLLGAVYVAALASAARRGVRATWLLPLVWLALSYSRVRHGPLFAMCAGVALADMLPHTHWLKRFSPAAEGAQGQADAPANRPWTIRHVALPAGLVAFAMLFQTAGIPAPVLGADRCTPDPQYWPAAAAMRLEDTLRTFPGENRVFNDMRFGGYLIYHVPEARLYIDDRCELHGDAGLRRYLDLHRNPQRFAGLAEYEQIHLALVDRDSPIADYLALHPDWLTLHRDSTACLFQRQVRSAHARP